jgi:hypothetical protein
LKRHVDAIMEFKLLWFLRIEYPIWNLQARCDVSPAMALPTLVNPSPRSRANAQNRERPRAKCSCQAALRQAVIIQKTLNGFSDKRWHMAAALQSVM